MRKVEAHPLADALVAAARERIGIPFRPQGRGAEGLDCLGLVLAVGRAVGLELSVPAFPLRGMRADEAVARLIHFGCRQVAEAAPGDVVLGVPASRQVHLAVWTGGSLVEAHAGLGRVVERCRNDGETWDSAWRLPEGEVAWRR